MRACFARACALHALGRIADALDSYREARGLAPAAGDASMMSAILTGIGELHRADGRLDEAEAAYDEALAISRAGGNARSASVALGNLTCHNAVALGSEITLEHPLNDLRLLRINPKALVDQGVAEGHIATDKHATLAHLTELVPQPIGRDFPFKLGEGEQDIEDEPSGAVTRVEVLRDGYEANAVLVK